MPRRRLLLSGVLLLLPLACGPFAPSAREGPPNLVVVSVDTLRADHLEAYGYERETAPHVARLARDGVLFEDALSQAPWTLPSLASLHTSLHPSRHGALKANHKLPEEVVTAAEVLREHGYRTLGVGSHVFTSARRGMAQGFDVFDESQVKGHEGITSVEITGVALDQVREHQKRDPSRPFFLWVHYFDPHHSYMRHPEHGFADGYEGPLTDRVPVGLLNGLVRSGRLTDADVAYTVAVYDEEIAHMDVQIGVLLAGLEGAGLWDDTVLVLTADHGEAFMERGRFFHQIDVYDELVRVPLVIGGAIPTDLRGTRVEAAVELASVPATLMALAGVDEHPFRGRDLLGVASGGESGPAISEGMSAFKDTGLVVAVARDGWKLVHHVEEGESELYERRSDPAERVDRFADPDPDVAAIRQDLLRSLHAHLESEQAPEDRVDLTGAERERLRALGYEP